MRKIAFFINPRAGEGKKLGLKSSDDIPQADYSESESTIIGRNFVSSITFPESVHLIMPDFEIYKSDGFMQFPYTLVKGWNNPSSSADTKNFAKKAISEGAELLVFVGGDGTARDLLDAVGHAVPVIGVPAGIKMYSSVFAYTWMDAVKELEFFLSNSVKFEDKEILDYDFKEDRLKLFGEMSGIQSKTYNQDPKQVFASTDISSLGYGIAADMSSEISYIIGPGSTCNSILEALGVPGTDLLNFKIVKNRRVVKSRAGEEDILAAMKDGNYRLIISPIGGMGILVGRGNYELSDRVLTELRPENLIIVATREKMIPINEIIMIAPVAISDRFGQYVRISVGIDEFVIKKLKIIATSRRN